MLGQILLEDIVKVHLNAADKVFSVVTAGRAYYLGKSEDLDAWLEAINYNWVQTKRRFIKALSERPEDRGGSGGHGANELSSSPFLSDRAYCLEAELLKRGGNNSKWQRRRFFLSSEFLTYKKGSMVAGRIPMSAITNVQAQPIKGRDHSFAVVTPFRVYYLESSSEEEKDLWVKSINQNLKVFKSKGVSVEGILIEGFLYKAGRNGIWRRRYFIMHSDSMSYFFDAKSDKPLGTIELFRVTNLMMDIAKEQPNSFGLVTPGRTYKLATSRLNDRQVWYDLIKEYVAKQNIIH
jgi:hypothetical protein